MSRDVCALETMDETFGGHDDETMSVATAMTGNRDEAMSDDRSQMSGDIYYLEKNDDRLL